MKESVIIIGGGLGGLTTGAILAKEGHKVTVLEKNAIIGGGLQSFRRNGYIFETGMHILAGLREGGSVRKIFSYLGIMDRIKIRDVDSDCMDSIQYLSDNKVYRIAEGREAFVESLSADFPEERENLTRYVDAMYELSEELDLYYIRRSTRNTFDHSDDFFLAADKFIAKYVENKKLRDILAYMNPMYCGVAGHTPAYIHALLNCLYIDGPCRMIGSSQQIADSLKEVIEENNGLVLNNTSVTHIETADRMVQYVEDNKGNRYTADRYISAVHPCHLFTLLNEDAFPRSYRSRLESIPNSYSAFTLYLSLKEDTLPYINHTCYCQDDYGIIWNYSTEDNNEKWPQGFMFMTPPTKEDDKYAKTLIVTTPMNFSTVEKWADTKVGKRGSDYEAWKLECAEKLMTKLERCIPGVRDCVKEMYTSSPLTIRDYYNTKEGSMYGFIQDCEQLTLSQVPIYTKVKNLLHTGQNISLHGICGTPLTAIVTAEAIVGNNVVIDHINENYIKNKEL